MSVAEDRSERTNEKSEQRTGAMILLDDLQSDETTRKLLQILPSHMKPEFFVRVVINQLNKNPSLANCTRQSFIGSVLDLAAIGLEPDGRRAHLIPYGKTCTYQLDYKGIAELVLRSGKVSHVAADVIRRGDIFVWNKGQLKEHVPHFLRTDENAPEQAGDVFAAYSLVVFKDGTERAEVMSRADILAIRDGSPGWQAFSSNKIKDNPWDPRFPHKEFEMWKKGLALDTPIPTVDGWTTMGEIKAGDIVFDMHGRQTKVLGVSEVKNIPCYRITFSNGETVVCDDEHLWCAAVGSSASSQRKDGWPVYKVNELFDLKAKGIAVTMPVAGVLECDWADVPVDPYVLGFWLGNGGVDKGTVTINDFDYEEVTSRVAKRYELGAAYKEKGRATTVCFKKLKVELRSLGVLKEKHIPMSYLRLPEEQRRALLQGLVDSDGHLCKDRGNAIYATTSLRLAKDVYELVCSLGEVPRMKKLQNTGYGKVCNYFTVEWKPSFCPSYVERKSEKFRERKVGVYRSVKSIEKIESVPTRCIGVDSETKTYLCSRSMIPTHNTVFKRLSKWLPISAEAQAAIEKEDHNDYGDRNSNVVNSPSVRTVRNADDLKEELKRRNQTQTKPAVVHEDHGMVSKESLLLELKAANDPLTIIEIERDLESVRAEDRDEVLAAIESAKARL